MNKKYLILCLLAAGALFAPVRAKELSIDALMEMQNNKSLPKECNGDFCGAREKCRGSYCNAGKECTGDFCQAGKECHGDFCVAGEECHGLRCKARHKYDS